MGQGLVALDLGGKQIWIKGFAYTSKFRCLPHIAEAIQKKLLEPRKRRTPKIPKGFVHPKKRKKCMTRSS